MDKQKSNKKNYGTAYYAMAFLAAFFFEFYWIMTDPYNYFMLLGIGFIMIVMGYLTIDSILKAKADSEALKNEQNEMMLKAQKAIYIATKKNAKDSETRQVRNIKAMEIMMNKMISSQQALLEDKKSEANDMESLIDQLSASNAKLAKEVQSAITVNQLVKANADLVRNVKEALSANAVNNSSAGELTDYVAKAVGLTSDSSATMETVTTETIPEPEIVVEEAAADKMPDLALNEFDMSEMPSSDGMDSDTMHDIENEINLAQMEESEALEAMTVPDEMTPELDAEMNNISTEESPNKQLTEEEIAALFAGL